MPGKTDPLKRFHPMVERWFRGTFRRPTPAQVKGWKSIRGGRSTLLLAPTGSGKTLAGFLAAIDRLMFSPVPDPSRRLRVLYISPLKALAVDVERNLRAPMAGIAAAASQANGLLPAKVRQPKFLIRHPPPEPRLHPTRVVMSADLKSPVTA